MKFTLRIIALAACAAPVALSAQITTRGFDLTVANIMRGPEHFGREPQNISWSADGQWIYFQWNPPGTAWDAPSVPYRVRATSWRRSGRADG